MHDRTSGVGSTSYINKKADYCASLQNVELEKKREEKIYRCVVGIGPFCCLNGRLLCILTEEIIHKKEQPHFSQSYSLFFLSLFLILFPPCCRSVHTLSLPHFYPVTLPQPFYIRFFFSFC